MANEFTTKELLELAVERVLQGMGISDSTSNRIGSKRFTTINLDGEVCNTNAFKLKALLYAVAHVHSEIIAEHPELYHEGDSQIAGAFDLALAIASWSDESLAKMYFSAEVVEK